MAAWSTSVLFSSQEEEDAVDETDQEDWRTNADTQVRLDHNVKHSGTKFNHVFALIWNY